MRFRLVALATLVFCAVISPLSWAGPVFVKGPTASLDTSTGDYTVTFKESGLGNTAVTYSLTAATEKFAFQCFSGNTAEGSPQLKSFSNASSETTSTPSNGTFSGSISLVPEKDGASCGGGETLCLIGAVYKGVTFEDVTNSISFSMPDLKAAKLKVCGF